MYIFICMYTHTHRCVRVGTRFLVVSARWWSVMAKVFLAPVAENLSAS